jgi:hypothetical protein
MILGGIICMSVFRHFWGFMDWPAVRPGEEATHVSDQTERTRNYRKESCSEERTRKEEL